MIDIISENWFDVLQSVGIIGGLYLTYIATNKEVRSQKIEHLLQINQSHREIWGKTYSQPELLRIRKTDIDLEKSPITESERRLSTEVIMHIYSVHEAINLGFFNKGAMEKDIAKYLTFPIPNFVWQEVKGYYDEKFVSYIDDLLHQ